MVDHSQIEIAKAKRKSNRESQRWLSEIDVNL